MKTKKNKNLMALCLKIKDNSVSLVILCLLFIIIYDIFIDVSGISYEKLLGCEYCDLDSLSTNGDDICINNTLTQSNEKNIIVRLENIHPPLANADVRENITSSLSFLSRSTSKVKILKDKTKGRLF